MRNELTIIPLPDARLVPRYLLEQVKDRDWDVDEWYAYQAKLQGHVENLVLGLVDKDHQIKGMVWITVDGFSKWLFINTFTVDKKYQRMSKLIKFVKRYIKDLSIKLGIKRALWAARRTKALERYGFKCSEYQLMEHQF